MHADARGVMSGAAQERAQHGGAQVDCINFNRGMGAEQLRREAAITITEDDGAPASGEIAEKCATAALKTRTECKKFYPAVDTRQGVEVGRA
jgi:hypothetical protein